MSARAHRGQLAEIDPAVRLAFLLDALLVLGQREREAWVDVMLAGIPQVATARRDDVSEGAVAHRLKRAQRKVERALVEADIGPKSATAVAA